jgi:hypothetical protein
MIIKRDPKAVQKEREEREARAAAQAQAAAVAPDAQAPAEPLEVSEEEVPTGSEDELPIALTPEEIESVPPAIEEEIIEE